MFDKLLLPQNVLPTPKVGKGNVKQSKWHVVDLPSWVEAWNRYICVRLAYDLSMALELVKSDNHGDAFHKPFSSTVPGV